MSESKANKYSILRPIVGVSCLIIFLTTYWFWLDYKAFQKMEITFPIKELKFELKKGWGVGHLAHYLEANNVIESSLYLKALAKQYPQYSQLKTGEYFLPEKIKPLELLKLFTEGSVIQYSFQIIEGQNKWEILDQLLNKQKHLKFDLTRDNKKSFENEAIKKLGNKTDPIESGSIEGWLFPETYNYSKGDTAFSLIERSVKEMQKALREEWENREQGLPLNTPYEALVLASIIEKETGVSSERERISGVFIRRLQLKMRLQTDPTVIYGIGEHFNGDITWKDLKTPTPYNTRIIKGLPPTPIASPSRASIYAALHPAKEEVLYFVADGTGGHHFSKTLDEHNRAVKRWLKLNKVNKK